MGADGLLFCRWQPLLTGEKEVQSNDVAHQVLWERQRRRLERKSWITRLGRRRTGRPS